MDDLTKKAIRMLDKNPDLTIPDVAESMGISKPALACRLYRANYKRSNKEKNNDISDKKWLSILHDLETTLDRKEDIRKRHDIARGDFAELLQNNGYDIAARAKRIMSIRTVERNARRAATGGYKTPKGLGVLTQMQHKECLSGDGLSLLAHRLPFNQIAEVMR